MSMSNTEKTVKDIRRNTAVSSPLRRRSALFWMASEVRAR